MFTGIIEELGEVVAFEPAAAGGARLTVRARVVLSDLEIGGSIAVNGCCLTAVERTDDGLSADLSPETLEKTNLGALRAGSLVNLERPLLPTSRLSGHFVQGHVDATGELTALDELGDGNWRLRVRTPPQMRPHLVYKGSIAIDGISLTIAKLEADGSGGDIVEVAIIPHTYGATNLSVRRPGDRLNLEADMLAKHVARLLELQRQGS